MAVRQRRVAGTIAILCILALVAIGIAYETADPDSRRLARDTIEAGRDDESRRSEPADFLLQGPGRAALWVVTLALLSVGWLAVGRAFSDSWAGIFISRNNRFSLSQVQFVLWTLLFASATLTLFLVRLRSARDADALGFSLPVEAAFLMGISSVSFGGAQAIQAARRGKTPSATEVEKAIRSELKRRNPAAYATIKGELPFGSIAKHIDTGDVRKPLKVTGADPTAVKELEAVQRDVLNGINGTLARNASPADARLLNILQGDEITNRANMDLGKTQLAFFSFLAIVAYAVLLWRLFHDGSFYEGDGPNLDHLPTVSQGLVALLGASHAAYLGGKAAGSTTTT